MAAPPFPLRSFCESVLSPSWCQHLKVGGQLPITEHWLKVKIHVTMLINLHNVPTWGALLSHFSDEITEAPYPRLHNPEAAGLGLTDPVVPKLKPVRCLVLRG